jgi:hypothetical protein
VIDLGSEPKVPSAQTHAPIQNAPLSETLRPVGDGDTPTRTFDSV